MLAFPLFPTPASVCARLLNSLLRREDWARERLARHGGKSVRFVAAPWQLGLSMTAEGFLEVSDDAIVPDVTLTLPSDKLPQLPAILRRGDTDEITALLHIQGDAGLAQVVAELAKGLRWDIEDELAQRVGDVAAVRLMGMARGVARGAERSATRLSENVVEYLADESGQVLGRRPYEDWRQRLHDMQHALQRVEQRIERLERDAHRTGRA